MRILWLMLAATCIGIGIVGIIVPLLPTTPFVLAGGFAASRSSPRFLRWIHEHPRFGATIRDWRAYGAIPRNTKRAAVVSLLVSAVVVVVVFDELAVHLAVMAILLTVGVYLWTRPESPATPLRS